MSSAGLVLGIDVSTTATKAVLVDESGDVRATASSGYDLMVPEPLWAEQDPERWWQAAQIAIRLALEEADATGADVCAVGLTGQMHGLVLLDHAGQVLRPAILWNDQRAAAQCDALRDQLGLAELVRLTGNDAFPGFTAPKLMWVRDHEPEVFARIHQILLPKDYLRHRLTGGYATDRAGAGGTLLLDLGSRDWSPTMLEACDVRPEWLPPTHEGTSTTGRVHDEAAAATGLAAGTPVVAGGGDQSAGAVAAGAIDPGVVTVTLGTSGVVFAACKEALVDERGTCHAFPHAVPERWHVMGVMLSAAGSLRWARDTIAPSASFEELDDEATVINLGADGLLFLPYLSGERTPHADPRARGALVGLTLAHGRGHLIRAVLEGVAFGMADNLDLLRRVGVEAPQEIRVGGGGARSVLWRQILADVLGTELVTLAADEGAAFGAALLAGAGVGVWGDIAEACAAGVRLADRTPFDREHHERYQQVLRGYRAAYPALRDLPGSAPG